MLFKFPDPPLTDLEGIFILKTSKLELTHSASERQQQVEQLLTSLDQLSGKLITLLQLVEQSELPIIKSTTLLHKVETTTTAIESHLSSIFTNIGNLSPQALKATTESFMEQLETFLETLQQTLSSIDLSKLKQLSVSMHSLQTEIDNAIGNISINPESLQALVQAQVEQAIADQQELLQHKIHSLITENLGTQQRTYVIWGSLAFGMLMFLIVLFLSYQSSTYRKTIASQNQVIVNLAHMTQQQGR